MKKMLFVISVAALCGLYVDSEPGAFTQDKKTTQAGVLSPVKIADARKPEKDSDFSNFESRLSHLNPGQIKKTLAELESLLKSFENLQYEDLSEEQLQQFTRLNRQRAVLIKSYIFSRYGGVI